MMNKYPTTCVDCRELVGPGKASVAQRLRGAILHWRCHTCDRVYLRRIREGSGGLPPDLGGRDFLRRRINQRMARVKRNTKGRRA